MDNFLTAVYRRHGLNGIVAIIGGLGIVVIGIPWVIAHKLADAGEPVKVLYGLFEYTKASPRAEISPTPPPNRPISAKAKGETDAPEPRENTPTLKPLSSFTRDSGRVYIDMTPDELHAHLDAKKLTSYQEKRYIEQTFSGKWMRVTGEIRDLDANRQLDSESDHAVLTIHTGSTTVLADMPSTRIGDVSHLQTGRFVSLEGRLDSVDKWPVQGVALEDAMILEFAK